MIDIRKYTPDHQQEWNNFINCSKMPMFMFNRNFMEYHADRFEDFSLMFYLDDKLMAVMPASKHENELRSHGGLTYGGIISDEKMKQHHMQDCFAALLSFLKQNGFHSLLYKSIPYIYHKQPAQEDLYTLFRCGAQLLKSEPSSVINLKSPCKMPKGRKAQIARAAREGVIVEYSTDFETFIRLENHVLAQRHNTSAVHSSAELKLLHECFPENIKLLAAFLDGKMIAGTLLFIYENVVHTQYMAADDQAREIGALDLVINQAIKNYSTLKSYFDFGISTEDNGQILNEGLIAQKEGFGGRTVAYNTYKVELK